MKMQKHHLIFIVCAFFLLPANKINAQQTYSPATLDSIAQREGAAAEEKLSFEESSFTANYDLKYLRAEWNIDPRVYFISGKVTYYFQALSDFTQLFFDLSDSMQVQSY